MEQAKGKKPHSVFEAAWLHWAIVAFFLLVWAGIVKHYPVYFQRDDADRIWWIQRHRWTDCFIPTQSNALWRFSLYRPLNELIWFFKFKAFGFNAAAFQFLQFVPMLISLAFLYKIVARLRGTTEAYLSLVIWLAGFQYLLSTLFWFSASPQLIEVAAAMPGLYLFITGFEGQRWRMILGSLLMCLAFFSKEPSVVILPTIVCAYIATNGPVVHKWNRGKTIAYSILPLLAAPIFLKLFPYILRRNPETGGVATNLVQAAVERLGFYGPYMACGMAALVLVIPALYTILTKARKESGEPRIGFVYALLISAVIAAAITKLHLYPVGLLALLVGGLLVPGRYRFLAVWVFVPFCGLCFFAQQFQAYLIELSFGAAALAAIQAGVLVRDFGEWWRARVKSPTITRLAAALLILAVLGAGCAKLKKQAGVLRLRSDITMCLQDITPRMKELPRNATLVVVDVTDMGLPSDSVMRGEDQSKVLAQPSLAWTEADPWTEVIGRGDLDVTWFGNYRKHLRDYLRKSRVFVLLQTPTDHKYIEGLKLPNKEFASVHRGGGAMTLLELLGDK